MPFTALPCWPSFSSFLLFLRAMPARCPFRHAAARPDMPVPHAHLPAARHHAAPDASVFAGSIFEYATGFAPNSATYTRVCGRRKAPDVFMPLNAVCSTNPLRRIEVPR